MDQVTELLNGLSEEERAAILAASGEEEHIVIDSSRKIIVPETLRRLAVQFDHNMETVTFDCPRYWDGIDMKDMVIYINYVLPDSTVGTYIVDKAEVDSENDNIMHFDWTISHNVTQTPGKMAFAVCIRNTNLSGLEVNHWNTEINNECYISEGLMCENASYELGSDLIEKLNHMINNNSFAAFDNRIKELETATQNNEDTIEALTVEYGEIKGGVDDLDADITALEERIAELELLEGIVVDQ